MHRSGDDDGGDRRRAGLRGGGDGRVGGRGPVVRFGDFDRRAGAVVRPVPGCTSGDVAVAPPFGGP